MPFQQSPKNLKNLCSVLNIKYKMYFFGPTATLLELELEFDRFGGQVTPVSGHDSKKCYPRVRRVRACVAYADMNVITEV
jgi:hypothetical protein